MRALPSNAPAMQPGMQLAMQPGGGTTSFASNASGMQSGTHHGNGMLALPMHASAMQHGMQSGNGMLALPSNAYPMHPGSTLSLLNNATAMQTGMSIIQSGSVLALQAEQRSEDGDLQIVPNKQPDYEPGREQLRLQAEALERKKPLTMDERKRGLARTAKPMDERLRKPWEKKAVMHSLEAKIEQYAWRHGGEKAMTRERAQRADDGGFRQKELAILDQMRKDEQAGILQLPVEEAAAAALRSGFREYVDYTVDEVDRFNNTQNMKQTAEFDWSGCGDAQDVPVLRRSKGQNRVDGAPSHLAGLGQGHDDMFAMDFLRDFCKRQLPEEGPPNEFRLGQMALAARELMPPELHRADNGAPLFKDEDHDGLYEDEIRVPSPEEVMMRTTCSWGATAQKNVVERQWAVEYSVV